MFGLEPSSVCKKTLKNITTSIITLNSLISQLPKIIKNRKDKTKPNKKKFFKTQYIQSCNQCSS